MPKPNHMQDWAQSVRVGLGEKNPYQIYQTPKYCTKVYISMKHDYNLTAVLSCIYYCKVNCRIMPFMLQINLSVLCHGTSHFALK